MCPAFFELTPTLESSLESSKLATSFHYKLVTKFFITSTEHFCKCKKIILQINESHNHRFFKQVF